MTLLSIAGDMPDDGSATNLFKIGEIQMTTENIKTSTAKQLSTAASKEGSTTVDPRQRILRRVEDRLSLALGKRVRVGGEADHLILSIRDEMVYRQDEAAILELRFLLEESQSEYDELRKTIT